MQNLYDQLCVGIYWFLNRENGDATIKIDPKSGTVDIGGQTANGRLRVNDANDRTAFILDAATRTIEVLNEAGKVTIRFDGRNGTIQYTGEVQSPAMAV